MDKKNLLEIFRDQKAIIFLILIIVSLWAFLFSYIHTNFFRDSFNDPLVLIDLNKSQKVWENDVLTLEFDYPMDKKSVEENINFAKTQSWTFRWLDDRTLIFEPDDKLNVWSAYDFYILEDAVTSDGKRIGRDLKFHFEVSLSPTLVTSIPKSDSENIPVDASITLVFDRPAVALAIVHSKKNPENWSVNIQPEIKWQWKWLWTTTVKFIPEDSFVPATKYHVSIPAWIEMNSGKKTVDDFSFDFTTERPNVISTYPENNSKQIEPDVNIVLDFNMPIDLLSAKEKISMLSKLKDQGTGSISEISISYWEIEKDWIKKEDRSVLNIKPIQKLKINSTEYKIVVSKDIKGLSGDLWSVNDYIVTFETVWPMFVKEWESHNGYSSYIRFSNPLKDWALKGKISINPKIEWWDELDFNSNSWDGKYFSFNLPLKPSMTYTLTIDQSIVDKWGQNLPSDYKLKLITEAVESKVFINSDWEFGIFEKDMAPIYYLNWVNVSNLDLKFAKPSFQEFLNIRSNKKKDYNYEPVLKNFEQYSEFSFPLPKNIKDEWEAMAFDPSEKLWKNLESGIYVLSLTAAEYKRSWWDKKQVTDYQYFVLTNIWLTLKYSWNNALLWAVNLKTWKPIEDALIKFYSTDHKELISGKTDGDWFFESNLNLKDFVTTENSYNPEFWVTAEYKDDFSFIGSNWSSWISPYNFGFGYDFHWPNDPEYTLDSYVYTERPIYRPGDNVNFKWILRLRDSDWILYPPKKSRSALVKIFDSKNNEIFNKTLDITKFWSFNSSIPLDKNVPLGDYYLETQIIPDNDIKRNRNRMNFSVLAYRKPEYRVELNYSKADFFNHDIISLDIEGSYYFWAPLIKAKFNWRAKTTDYFFNKFTDGWYSFALEDSWCWWDCERKSSLVTTWSGFLDESGKSNIKFPINIDDKGLWQIVSVEVDVSDPNNQVVSNRLSVPVHKSSVYVGINSEDYVVKPGQEAIFNIVTLTPAWELIAWQDVLLKLFSRTWNSIRKKSVDGRYYYDNEPKDEYISEIKVETNEDWKTNAKIKIPRGGQYRIIAETKDERNRVHKAWTSLYSWSSAYVNWPHNNHDRIDVIADKPEYAVGDIAKLLVKSPYQWTWVKALITVERENIIRKELIDVTSNAQVFDIKITEDLIPNAYVSVVIIKPRSWETFNENGLDTWAPAFKIGYNKLLVETVRKKINLTLETDKKKYGPWETVTVKLLAKDYNGDPQEVEFSLWVVDMSVLALTGFQMPDLIKRFYAQRPLWVMTSELLTFLLERFKPWSKWWGWSDPETKKRGNFKDTAYWNPVINTDENGKAQIQFKLPDNLTTWKLLAIWSTINSNFWAIAEEIIETKKVILRPVRPRFAVVWDEIYLAAIVHNYLDEDAKFRVSLRGSWFTIQEKAELDIEIWKNDSKKVYFPIKVKPWEKITLNFLADSRFAHDEVEESIPVFAFWTPQSVATSWLTDSITEEKLLVPSRSDASIGSLSISISPTLASYLPKWLEYLVRFPYGCAEQTISKLFPNVALSQLNNFDAFEIVDKKELEFNIIAWLEKLYSFQRSDWGFGYWEGSMESFPYLSAYILYAFNKIKWANYSVDENSINNAISYLQSVLRNQDLENPIDLSTRAYILYVLWESGKADLSMLNNLYEKNDKLALFSKAYLAMAYKNLDLSADQDKSKILIDDILTYISTDDRKAFFNEVSNSSYRSLMHTDNRTNAIILQALVRIEPNNVFIPKIVRYILSVREDGHWDTTQSTALSIFAMVEFLDSTWELNADMVAWVSIDKNQPLDHRFNNENVLTKKEIIIALSEFEPDQESLIKIWKSGTWKLYYDLLFSYFYAVDEIAPEEEGFGITREFISLTWEEIDDTNEEVRVWNTYKVKLVITSPDDRYFVALESPVPAWMEILDSKLKTSQQNLIDEQIDNCNNNWTYGCWRNNNWRFNHKEFRDDKLFMFADYLPAWVYEYEYLVRATTPWKFRYRPSRVWEMYFPENFGQTDANWFTINDEQ